DYSSGKATSISGITIDGADAKKFAVKFTRPFCPALLSVFGAAPLPAHIFGKYTVDNDPSKNVDEAPENTAPPVASGPLKFKEWRKGDQLTLVRNETYWAGAPLLDEYVLKVVADSTVVAAQLTTCAPTPPAGTRPNPTSQRPTRPGGRTAARKGQAPSIRRTGRGAAGPSSASGGTSLQRPFSTSSRASTSSSPSRSSRTSRRPSH